jgi:hypothetical protein
MGVLCLLPGLTFCSVAAAAQPHEGIEAGITVGYANLSLNDTAGNLDGKGGLHFEPRLTWRGFERMPQLGIGFAVGISFYRDESPNPDATPVFGLDPEDAFEEMELVVPELQLSWRQPVSKSWAVEGGVGVGWAYADYSAGDLFDGNFVISSFGDEDSSVSVHPFVRAGHAGERWTIGVEAGYLWTDIDFGPPVGDGLSEWRVGLFFNYAS